ncbi:MAG: hypothetical protein E7159_03660 [Firmicutes bacterium]|nr:hypothetical protein [Bacillota bacterium]
MKFKLYIVSISVISLFGYFYLKDNIKYSNSYEVISYSNDYEIGIIKIPLLNIDRKLMQGLDNKYYLDHNYLNMDSNNGEFFLDTYGDLLNNNNSIIYSSTNNLDVNDIRINDIVNIKYLDNDLCYKVLSINNNLKHDLIIKLLDRNKEYNIFLLKNNC